jgi:hypothetical protein
MKKVLIIKDPENATIEIIVDGERIFIGNYFEFKPEFDLYEVIKKISDDVTILIKRGLI